MASGSAISLVIFPARTFPGLPGEGDGWRTRRVTTGVSAERERVLRFHFTEWAEEFDVRPFGSGYADESGNAAYPAHVVCEPERRGVAQCAGQLR